MLLTLYFKTADQFNVSVIMLEWDRKNRKLFNPEPFISREDPIPGHPAYPWDLHSSPDLLKNGNLRVTCFDQQKRPMGPEIRISHASKISPRRQVNKLNTKVPGTTAVSPSKNIQAITLEILLNGPALSLPGMPSAMTFVQLIRAAISAAKHAGISHPKTDEESTRATQARLSQSGPGETPIDYSKKLPDLTVGSLEGLPDPNVNPISDISPDGKRLVVMTDKDGRRVVQLYNWSQADNKWVAGLVIDKVQNSAGDQVTIKIGHIAEPKFVSNDFLLLTSNGVFLLVKIHPVGTVELIKALTFPEFPDHRFDRVMDVTPDGSQIILKYEGNSGTSVVNLSNFLICDTNLGTDWLVTNEAPVFEENKPIIGSNGKNWGKIHQVKFTPDGTRVMFMQNGDGQYFSMSFDPIMRTFKDYREEIKIVSDEEFPLGTNKKWEFPHLKGLLPNGLLIDHTFDHGLKRENVFLVPKPGTNAPTPSDQPSRKLLSKMAKTDGDSAQKLYEQMKALLEDVLANAKRKLTPQTPEKTEAEFEVERLLPEPAGLTGPGEIPIDYSQPLPELVEMSMEGLPADASLIRDVSPDGTKIVVKGDLGNFRIYDWNWTQKKWEERVDGYKSIDPTGTGYWHEEVWFVANDILLVKAKDLSDQFSYLLVHVPPSGPMKLLKEVQIPTPAGFKFSEVICPTSDGKQVFLRNKEIVPKGKFGGMVRFGTNIDSNWQLTEESLFADFGSVKVAPNGLIWRKSEETNNFFIMKNEPLELTHLRLENIPVVSQSDKLMGLLPKGILLKRSDPGDERIVFLTPKPKAVIPAKAGIQAVNFSQQKVGNLDPRLRGDDGL